MVADADMLAGTIEGLEDLREGRYDRVTPKDK
jgi:hypothetical protein